MYGVILIILVVGISGFIAYIGDQIGMKVGKKRISIFGLRPKYSSILITILTGVLIASLAITTILATNNGVRQLIFNIQEVQETLGTLTSELDEVNQQLSFKDIELKNMQEEIEERELELSLLQETKEELAEENDILEKQKEDLEIKLSKLEIELDTAQGNIDELKETKDYLESQLEELNTIVAELGDERFALEEEIKELSNELERVNQSLSDTTFNYYLQDLVYQKGDIVYRDIIEKGQDVNETVANLMELLAEANQEVMKYPVRVSPETGTALRFATEDILAVAASIDQSDKEKFIVSLTSNVNVSQNNYVYVQPQVNESYVVFEAGDVISKRIVNSNISSAQLQEEIEGILGDVNSVAIRSGVLGDEQGRVGGSIVFSEFYQLMDQIKMIKGQVEIKVIANQDIRREDGWNQEFSQKISFNIEEAN